MSFAWIDVGIFFFISGYGLTYGYYNKEGYLQGFWKRIVKVLVPFLLAHFVYAAADLIFGIQFTTNDVLRSLIGNSTLVKNDWYVPALLIFYALFWAIFSSKLPEKRKHIILLLSIIIYVLVFSLLFGLMDFWWMNALPFWGGAFAVMVLRKDNCKMTWAKWLLLCFSGYAIAFIGVPVSNRLVGDYHYEIFYSLMSLFGVGLVMLIYSRIGHGNALTRKAAPYTYEIYLYHGLFIQIFRCQRLYITNDVAFVLAVYGATFLLAFVMHQAAGFIFRRIPSLRTHR